MRGAWILFGSYVLGLLPGFMLFLAMRHRTRLARMWELLVFVPFAVWYLGSSHWGPPGTLANALVEPFALGVPVGLLHSARLLVKPLGSGSRSASVLYLVVAVTLASTIALAYSVFFPDLPE